MFIEQHAPHNEGEEPLHLFPIQNSLSFFAEENLQTHTDSRLIYKNNHLFLPTHTLQLK